MHIFIAVATWLSICSLVAALPAPSPPTPGLLRIIKQKSIYPWGKHFREAKFSNHYDRRFAEIECELSERKKLLRSLLHAYLSTMSDIGVDTWIMHGSLLGWFWNQRIMPWDSDLDVQVTDDSLRHLASHYNMSTHRFDSPGDPEGRSYLLEVNPHWDVADPRDKLNHIDARWIDMQSGLFIDLTALVSVR
jgi:hypothetical protein